MQKDLHSRVQARGSVPGANQREANRADGPRTGGISDTSIHHWRKELVEYGSPAFPSRGHQTTQEEKCIASNVSWRLSNRNATSYLEPKGSGRS